MNGPQLCQHLSKGDPPLAVTRGCLGGWEPLPPSPFPTRARVPQEILEEVVRELHKVKEEIIDGEHSGAWARAE